MKTTIVGSLAHVARIAALPIAAFALPAVAHAQRGTQRELFEWRGSVDQEVRIQMRGGQTAVMGMGPHEATGYNQVRALSGVPSANGYVSVQMMQGRGIADVVQQPSPQNGYTTIVRVRDTQGGAGAYDVAAYWQPAGNTAYGAYGTNGVYGTNGAYGRQYPTTGTTQQVYRNGYPVTTGGKVVPGAQTTAPVYNRYPVSGQRVTPNGKVLPSGAQQAHARKYDRKYDKRHDTTYDHRDHDNH